jgi:hypothetical protein
MDYKYVSLPSLLTVPSLEYEAVSYLGLHNIIDVTNW